NCIVCSGFHYPLEVFFTYTATLDIRSRVSKIDSIRNTVSHSQFHGIKVIAQVMVDAQYDILHLLQSFRTWRKFCLVTCMMRITWFVGHDTDMLSADAITAVIFSKNNFFL